MSEDGRRRHYGGFYGLEELPATGRPRLAVFGNCQAEALRVALDTAGVLDSVRMPPVHELDEADLPHLDRLLAWVDVLVAQSVADDYRGMPLGTSQVAARLRPQARVVHAPNYFFSGLYPEQVLVRHPEIEDPPVVPYHDVRRLGRAAGWDGPWEAPAELVREVAAASLAELERRERAQQSLRISDVVRASGAAAGRTVDHPGNEVLLALARRVLEEVRPGSGEAVQDPGRVLLASVATPLSRGVLEALDLPGEPREGWLVDGEAISDDEVGAAHQEFYARHPRVVEVGMEKREDLLRRWGWRA